MSDIISFYEGNKPDAAPYSLHEIWDLPILEIETSHDIIQWLFPLNVASNVNLDAPILTQDDINAFCFMSSECDNYIGSDNEKHNNRAELLQTNLYGSSHMFMRFLHCTSDTWCKKNNHNHLRITRMIKCLMLLELEGDAKSLYLEVLLITKRYPNVDFSRAMSFWSKAAIGAPKQHLIG